MAENTQLPLLSFGYGAEANLPSAHSQGKIYITTDKHRMYVDLPGANDRLCLNNFELVTGNLPTTGIAGQFYVKKVTTGSGDEAVTTYSLHCYDGNSWKEIINVVDLENAIANLEDRMDEVEGRLNTYDSDWAELPDTYVAKSGDTMTGDLVMSGNNITNLASGGTTETNAANIGDVNSAVSTHAGVKATGTILGHVTLSDAVKGTETADKGVAATPKAVAEAYALAESAKSKAEGIVLTPFIKKDGTVAMEADLNLGTHKLINVVDPVADQDAATKKYVDDIVGADPTETDTDGSGLKGRIGALEDSLGEAVENDAGKADGTAYERIAKNASDIADHASRLTIVEGIAGSAVQPDDLNSYVTDAELQGYDATLRGTYSGNLQALNALAQQGVDNAKAADDKADGAASAAAGAQSRADDAYALAETAKQIAETKTTMAEVEAKGYDTVSSVDGKFTALKGGSTNTLKQIDENITAVDSKVEQLAGNIGNLSNIMNFVGVTTTAITDGAEEGPATITVNNNSHTAAPGDVVIYQSKEYVCVGTSSKIPEGASEPVKYAQWNLIGDTGAESTAITNLQNTVGTKPTGDNVPTMDDKLWDEVADLRTDLGERTDDTTKTTAFGRIASLEALTETQSSAIVGLGNQLTWVSFD